MSENNTDILIGYLSEVRGNGMDARVVDEHSGDSPIIVLGNEAMLAGQIGSYVVIKQVNIKILALVFKVWEKYRFEQDGSRQSDRFENCN